MATDVEVWRKEYRRMSEWTWTLFRWQLAAFALQALGLVLTLGSRTGVGWDKQWHWQETQAKVGVSQRPSRQWVAYCRRCPPSHLKGNEEKPCTCMAMRRYVYTRLIHDEKGTPMHRRILKMKKMISQKGLCAICRKKLPKKGAELDRRTAMLGYTEKNTRLVHHNAIGRAGRKRVCVTMRTWSFICFAYELPYF